jgi:hypothetical protein
MEEYNQIILLNDIVAISPPYHTETNVHMYTKKTIKLYPLNVIRWYAPLPSHLHCLVQSMQIDHRPSCSILRPIEPRSHTMPPRIEVS